MIGRVSLHFRKNLRNEGHQRGQVWFVPNAVERSGGEGVGKWCRQNLQYVPSCKLGNSIPST